MGDFDEHRKNREEQIARDRLSKETLGKFFYDLAKVSFASFVVGGIMSADTDVKWVYMLAGGYATFIFAYFGYRIIKYK